MQNGAAGYRSPYLSQFRNIDRMEANAKRTIYHVIYNPLPFGDSRTLQ